jgi:hypothetical protein
MFFHLIIFYKDFKKLYQKASMQESKKSPHSFLANNEVLQQTMKVLPLQKN